MGTDRCSSTTDASPEISDPEVHVNPPPDNYDSAKAECRECGYGYLWDEFEDRELHRHFHDEWQYGIRYEILPDEAVVIAESGIEFIIVEPDSSKQQRELAARVALIANREMGYDFPSYDGGDYDQETGAIAFLGRLEGRAIGLFVVRRCHESVHVDWPEYSAGRVTKPVSQVRRWAVDFIWVRNDLRRRGTALSLLRLAARVLEVPMEDFAWQSPFEQGGEALLRKTLPHGIWIARD
jgi:hypothetical protein